MRKYKTIKLGKYWVVYDRVHGCVPPIGKPFKKFKTLNEATKERWKYESN